MKYSGPVTTSTNPSLLTSALNPPPLFSLNKVAFDHDCFSRRRKGKWNKVVKERRIQLKEICQEWKRDQHCLMIIFIIFIIWWIKLFSTESAPAFFIFCKESERQKAQLRDSNKLSYPTHGFTVFADHFAVHHSYFLRNFLAQKPFSWHAIRLSQFQHHDATSS